MLFRKLKNSRKEYKSSIFFFFWGNVSRNLWRKKEIRGISLQHFLFVWKYGFTCKKLSQLFIKLGKAFVVKKKDCTAELIFGSMTECSLNLSKSQNHWGWKRPLRSPSPTIHLPSILPTDHLKYHAWSSLLLHWMHYRRSTIHHSIMRGFSYFCKAHMSFSKSADNSALKLLLQWNQAWINQMTSSKAHSRARNKTRELCLPFILIPLQNTALLLRVNPCHKER